VYEAALLDHRYDLDEWALDAWRLCGPVTP